jgi:hypothetical protein
MHQHKIILGVLLIVLVGFAISSVQAKHENIPLPHPAKAINGDQCVEPNDIMRRNHMTYLMHQRDETVIEGIRGKKYSLQQCINCHATIDPEVQDGKVRTIKPFCAECHSYAAVKIDCFACHNPSVPLDKTSETPLSKMIAAHLREAGDSK